MTNNLEGRIYEHKHGLTPGYTSAYNTNRLVYMETFPSPGEAIAREKQLKGWRRSKKIALIEGVNPGWHDLSVSWFTNDHLE